MQTGLVRTACARALLALALSAFASLGAVAPAAAQSLEDQMAALQRGEAPPSAEQPAPAAVDSVVPETPAAASGQAVGNQGAASQKSGAKRTNTAPPPESVRAEPPRPVIAPAPVSAASVATSVQFSPEIAAILLVDICANAADQEGGIEQAAVARGYAASAISASFAWAVPADARVWLAPSLDSAVYLMSSGRDNAACSVVISRPLSDVVGARLVAELVSPARAFSATPVEVLDGGVRYTRLKRADFTFIDILDYPVSADRPAALRADWLRPN